jgi:hypothetical protein
MFRETKRNLEDERVVSNNKVARNNPAACILAFRLADAPGLLVVELGGRAAAAATSTATNTVTTNSSSNGGTSSSYGTLANNVLAVGLRKRKVPRARRSLPVRHRVPPRGGCLERKNEEGRRKERAADRNLASKVSMEHTAGT